MSMERSRFLRGEGDMARPYSGRYNNQTRYILKCSMYSQYIHHKIDRCKRNLFHLIVYVDIKLHVGVVFTSVAPSFNSYHKEASTVNVASPVHVNLTRNEGWNIGSCSSVNIYPDVVYPDNRNLNAKTQLMRTMTRSCWLTPGDHVLECYNKDYSKGWPNAYIEIQGHRYCDDFVSIKAFRRIRIAGHFS